jgi:hypothetical protein
MTDRSVPFRGILVVALVDLALAAIAILGWKAAS